MPTKAYAAQSKTTPLAQTTIERREPGKKDVAIEILYCGVCHSDLCDLVHSGHQIGHHHFGSLFRPCRNNASHRLAVQTGPHRRAFAGDADDHFPDCRQSGTGRHFGAAVLLQP